MITDVIMVETRLFRINFAAFRLITLYFASFCFISLVSVTGLFAVACVASICVGVVPALL